MFGTVRRCLLLLLSIYIGYAPPCRAAPPPPSGKTRVIMLGADGLTDRVIKRMVKENKLPNIQAMIKHGSYGKIASIKPTHSPALWTTMATGKKREQHGVNWFYVRNKDGALVLSNSTHRKTKALWNIFSDNNMKTGMIGHYTTWPVEAINGFMISDISIFPIEKGFYPPETGKIMQETLKPLFNYTPKHLGEFAQMFLSNQYKYFTPQMFSYLDQLGSSLVNNYKQLSEKKYNDNKWKQHQMFIKRNNLTGTIRGFLIDNIRFEYAKKMYRKDIDFFFLFLKGADILSHLNWHYYEPDSDTPKEDIEIRKDIIPNYYKFVDKVLGYFLQQADTNTVVILVSDHGFRAEKKGSRLTFDFNKIFNTMGYLKYRFNIINKAEKSFDLRARRRRPRKPFSRLHVNLDNLFPGRDPKEDGSKMEKIIARLASVRTGEIKFFKKINYHTLNNKKSPLENTDNWINPEAEEEDIHPNPDLPITSGVYQVDVTISKALTTKEFLRKYAKSNMTITIDGQSYPLHDYVEYSLLRGRHDHRDGVVGFWGPMIKKGHLIEEFGILDITPTILKIFDMPIGADMTGVVRQGIFSPEFLINHQTKFIKSYDEINKALPRSLSDLSDPFNANV